MRGCTVEGCNAPHEGRGYCKEHYQQWYRYGDPLARTRRKRGSGWFDRGGYKYIGNTQEHILIAETAIGKALPAGAVVHHSDRNPMNNDPRNLVICSSQAYHRLIHQRMDAFDACGNAGHRKCVRCGEYSSPDAMQVHQSKSSGSITYVHAGCRASRSAKNSKENT